MRIYGIAAILIAITSQSTGWEQIQKISFKAGDKIGCLLNGFLGHLNFKHWMLAVDSDHVIHVVRTPNTIFQAHVYKHNVREGNWSGLNQDHCINAGQGKLGLEGVQRALQVLDKNRTYSYPFCNCGHWVRHWAEGAWICDTSQ